MMKEILGPTLEQMETKEDLALNKLDSRSDLSNTIPDFSDDEKNTESQERSDNSVEGLTVIEKDKVREETGWSDEIIVGEGLKESPLQSSIEPIENSSLECVKAQNELIAEKNNVEKIEQIEKNREAGANREDLALKDLEKEFPEKEGFKIEREQFLRDKDGNIVKDSETGKARRIDFIITKDGEFVKSVEVTSETAPKEVQVAKEDRIRNEGGNFIKDRDTGQLSEIPKEKKTEIRRYP
ncbi:MAG: hypothetical protein JKY81_00070 [Colwellia sp.]|nr:hypothetical protein [Colwellia sp.]